MKKLTYFQIVGLYKALEGAKLTKLQGADKYKVLRNLRALRAAGKGWDEMVKDAQTKLDGDEILAMIDEEGARSIEVAIEPLGADVVSKLMGSNPEWPVGAIDLVDEILTAAESDGI